MDDNMQSEVRFPEDVKTKPNESGLGSAEGFVEFVQKQEKEKIEYQPK